MPNTHEPCPCGHGLYEACCGPYHQGTIKPATAEQLMRSRYSAFAKKLADYLVKTRHPSRQSEDTLSALEQSFSHTTWRGLTILTTENGQAKDHEGHVSFAADYQDSQGQGTLHERSYFKREADQWFYVEQDFEMGRNQPCWCGTGKKFKKCHGAT